MKKAVIYGRVSTQDQDFGRQVNELDDWAVKNGYQVVNRFAEKITGVSKAGERVEFSKMLKFIEQHQIKMILVSELSRIGRLGVHTRLEIETLAEKGVNIFFYDKNQYTLNSKGKVEGTTMMMIGLVLDLAKIEIDNTRNRIISGLKNSAKKGKIQGAKFKSYGFTGDVNKDIVPVESEMKVVKEMFKMYDNGLTTTGIASYLNDNKIPTRYNQFEGTLIRGKSADSFTWSGRTVYRILTNRMFIGERHHKKELVFQFEPIIEPALFERVQNRLADKTNRPSRMMNNTNHLKGIIHCTCGLPMYMAIDLTKRMNSYICLSKRYAKEKKCEACSNPSVNIDKLLNSLFLVLLNNFILKMKGKTINNFDERISMKNIELTSSTNTVKKLKTKLDNLYDDYNERLLSKAAYISKKEQLEQQIEQEVDNNKSIKNQLEQFNTLKNKPLKEFYTKDQFLMEVRNILQSVTIGTPSKAIEKQLKKTEQDSVIRVDALTINDQLFTYYISRRSSNYLYNGEEKPIETNVIKTLTKGGKTIDLSY
jgi:site-specific DNA recombinase